MTLHCECPCCYFVPICSPLSLCTEQPVWIDWARHGCHLEGNQKYRWTQATDAGHQERLARNTSIKAASNHCPVYSESNKIVISMFQEHVKTSSFQLFFQGYPCLVLNHLPLSDVLLLYVLLLWYFDPINFIQLRPQVCNCLTDWYDAIWRQIIVNGFK